MSNFIYTLILFIFGCICIEVFSAIRNKTNQPVSLKKENVLGTRRNISWENRNEVEVIEYCYDHEDNKGLIVVCHGGSLTNGDADMCDTFCSDLRDACKSVVVSVNYTKIDQQRPPYQQQEIVDTVLYYMSHKSEYHIKENNVVLVGFSGGSYIQIGAGAILCSNYQLKIKGQIAYYPLLDDSIINLTEQNLIAFPITLVTCNNENENQRVDTWIDHLKNKNCMYSLKEYPYAIQGFIEYNYPEYLDNPKFKRNLKSFDEEQQDMAKANFMWLTNEIEGYMDEV